MFEKAFFARSSVPQPDGSVIHYHEGHQPWVAQEAELGVSDEPEPVPDRLRPAIESIVDRLVAKDYAGLARDGRVSYASDPSDPSISTWIEDYPATLVALPAESWRYAKRGRWANLPDAWWVVVDLWTAKEGRGDLSMEATVCERGGQVLVVIDNVPCSGRQNCRSGSDLPTGVGDPSRRSGHPR